MSKKIIPMAGYVLVEDIEDNKLSSGIVVAEEEGKQSQMGKIIASGSMPFDFSTLGETTNFSIQDHLNFYYSEELNQMDTIIYKKYSGNEIELDGEKYKLVSFSDIIGLIK